jgi:hypothetical protein
MRRLLIKRVALTLTAVFGVVIGPDGVPFSLSLERPWMNNQVGLSCVPAGVFRAVRCRASEDYGFKDSPQFGDTFQVIVPGRSKILFHKGNLASDSHGCILIGEQFEPVNGVPGIAASAKGFDQFLRLMADVDEFELEIREV